MGGIDVQTVRVISITAMAWGLCASRSGGLWMRGVHGSADTVGKAKPQNAGDTDCDIGAASRRRMGAAVGVGAGRVEEVTCDV